jgi:hypothetical protein
MGNAESKKHSNTITPINTNTTETPMQTKKNKNKQYKSTVEPNIPLNSAAVFNNKEFLNDLSLFIVKAYDTKFDGTFNEFIVNLYNFFFFKKF